MTTKVWGKREITSWGTKQSRERGDNAGKGRKAKTKQGEAKKESKNQEEKNWTIFEEH